MCVLPATCSARVRSSPSAALPSQTFPRQRPRRRRTDAQSGGSRSHVRPPPSHAPPTDRSLSTSPKTPTETSSADGADGAAPLLLPLFYPPLPPFTIARSSDRSLPLSQALGPLYAPASHCQSAESTSGAGAPRRARTGPACRPLSCGGLLAAVTFLPGLSRRGRSRPKLAKGGGSLCLTLWIHIEPEERHRTIPIKPMCFLS